MAKGNLVTADSVYAAADRLARNGRAPTLRAVRRELGGGSFGSILPFLQSWRRTHDVHVSEAGDKASEMDPRLSGALDRLFSAASDVAEAIQDSIEHKEQEGMSPELRQELIALQKIAVEQIGKLRSERDFLSKELDDARQELRELRAWRRRALQHMKTEQPVRVNADQPMRAAS